MQVISVVYCYQEDVKKTEILELLGPQVDYHAEVSGFDLD